MQPCHMKAAREKLHLTFKFISHFQAIIFRSKSKRLHVYLEF